MMTVKQLIAQLQAAAEMSSLGLETPVRMADPPSQSKGETYPVREALYVGWEDEPDVITLEGEWT